MARNNYAGYYFSVQGVPFNDPSPKRESFKYAPQLEQVGDSSVLASGYLSIKTIPHTRKKIWFSLPPMTQAQYQRYWDALHGDSTGKGMHLFVSVYNDKTDSYDTDYFYHTDLVVSPITYQGEMMYVFDDFELIGY